MLALAILSLILGAVHPVAIGEDPPLPTGAEVLARVEKALGDEARRGALKTVVMKGKFTMEGTPPCLIEELFAGPKVKCWYSMEGFGEGGQGCFDGYCWSFDASSGIVIKEGAESGSVARMYDVFRCRPWLSNYASAEVKGEESVGGKRCFVLELTPKCGGATDRLWVDTESSLPSCFGSRFPDPQGGVLETKFEFSDWRDVDGLRFPFVRAQHIGTSQYPYRFDSIEIDVEIDGAKLAPPPEVEEAYKDPKKRATQADESGACTTETLEELPALSIRETVDEARISEVLAVALPEVMKVVMLRETMPAAPPFLRIHGRKDGKVDIESGFPLRKAVEGEGRVVRSTLPGGKAAMTWHIGPYEEIPKSAARLEAWIAEQKLESAGGHWEVFWTDPGLEPNPAKWRTQLLWPVRGSN